MTDTRTAINMELEDYAVRVLREIDQCARFHHGTDGKSMHGVARKAMLERLPPGVRAEVEKQVPAPACGSPKVNTEGE